MEPNPQNLIICPVCYRVTGEMLSCYRPVEIRYFPSAADPPDGFRCQAHARTVLERIDESQAAMASVWRR